MNPILVNVKGYDHDHAGSLRMGSCSTSIQVKTNEKI